jgi:hypothetical protein
MAFAATADQPKKRRSASDYTSKAVNAVQTAQAVTKAARTAQAVGAFIAATWEFWLIVLVIIIIVALFLVIITTILGQNNNNGVGAQPGPPPVQAPNEVVYCQAREAWSNQPYNDGTIASTGCAPTSMAMILSSYGGTSYTPGQIATMFHDNGWDWRAGSGRRGTNPWRITSSWLDSMGFKRAQADIVNNLRHGVILNTKQLEQIENYTDAGWLLLAAVDGRNLPTRVNGGHEVVIENANLQANTITIRDPNDRNCRSGKTVTINASNVEWILITPIKVK